MSVLNLKTSKGDAASNVRNYKECDELTKQMSILKNEKRLLDTELSALTRKQKKSVWYKKKRIILMITLKVLTRKFPNDKSKSLLVTRSLPFSTVKSSLPSSSDSPASSSISSKRKSTSRVYLSSVNMNTYLVPIMTPLYYLMTIVLKLLSL